MSAPVVAEDVDKMFAESVKRSSNQADVLKSGDNDEIEMRHDLEKPSIGGVIKDKAEDVLHKIGSAVSSVAHHVVNPDKAFKEDKEERGDAEFYADRASSKYDDGSSFTQPLPNSQLYYKRLSRLFS